MPRTAAGRRRRWRHSPAPWVARACARPRSWRRPGKHWEHRDQPPPSWVTLMVTDSAPSDVEVVARVLGGDGEAFGILIRRYEPGLLRFATRMLGNPDAAADAVAESLVRAYRHLVQCRDPGRLRRWPTARIPGRFWSGANRWRWSSVHWPRCRPRSERRSS